MALNYKNIKADTLGRVDAALTILERYPKLPDVSSYISANVPIPWSMTDEYNPFMYLLDLFKRTVGYDSKWKNRKQNPYLFIRVENREDGDVCFVEFCKGSICIILNGVFYFVK